MYYHSLENLSCEGGQGEKSLKTMKSLGLVIFWAGGGGLSPSEKSTLGTGGQDTRKRKGLEKGQPTRE